MFVDSHCHLNYLDDGDDAVRLAAEAGVEQILCIGVDANGIDDVLAFADKYEHVHATVGEHPGSASHDQSWMDPYIDRPKVVALGEMGLDYHYESERDKQRCQRDSFAVQMDKARSHNLPVVIHTRAAQNDTIAILHDFPDVVGVLHCFTESWKLASAGLEAGYYISISGIVTFNNADNVREVARQVPAERLLIETDAPWLAPTPHRGKQNQPAFVSHTAQYLAELRGESIEELAAQTTANYRRLFSLAC